MRVLALDFGTKRIGLAWTDTALDLILPYGVVTNQKAIINLVKKEKVDKIVVGFPLGLSNNENSNTARVKNFVFELQKETSIPIELFDERYTSQAADSAGGSVSRDERSAMQILSGYLLKNKK